MNAETLLQLIHDLYAQLTQARLEISVLKQQLAVAQEKAAKE